MRLFRTNPTTEEYVFVEISFFVESGDIFELFVFLLLIFLTLPIKNE